MLFLLVLLFFIDLLLYGLRPWGESKQWLTILTGILLWVPLLLLIISMVLGKKDEE